MLELLQQSFESINSLSGNAFMLTIIFASVLFVPICAAYAITFSARAFNKRFMITLALLTVVSGVIVNVIGDSVALAIIVLAAVMLVRVKPDGKDPRLGAFLLWSVAVGICSGRGLYFEATLVTVVVFVVLVIIGGVQNSGKFMLVVKTLPSFQRTAEETVSAFFNGKAKLRMRNASADNAELIYDISKKDINKYAEERGNSITEVMLQLEGVKSVDLVSGNLDMLA